MSETSTLYKYGAATQGFLLWTSWAFYVNYQTSISAGIKSGLVQGIFSFVSTLIVISLLTKIFNYLDKRFLKLIVPTALMVSALTTILIFAHTIASTPEIIKTIVPSLVVAALFCSFTTYKLNKAKPTNK